MPSFVPPWLAEILPIFLLLAVIGVVLARLPKVELGHSKAFLRRRFWNWFPLGMTYAFLYMGRYNLTVAKDVFVEMTKPDGAPMMTNADFGYVFGIGTVVYGVSFLLNGPLTDRYGGKLAILVSAGGAAVANILLGLATWSLAANGPGSDFIAHNFMLVTSVLYGANMYFQSFGAVAIVKVNAPWFHVRERGVFGAIFGILISLGIYFAFDWSKLVVDNLPVEWAFAIPGLVLVTFFAISAWLVKTTPSEAGFADFDTADASSGDDGPRLSVAQVFKKMLSNPVIVTIACIEFCSGFLRQAIMQWYRTFAKQTDALLHETDTFVYDNWGMLLCIAGILGGTIAGVISDRVFQSRRGPVAGVLYGAMLAGAAVLVFTYATPAVGLLVIVMSMAVIGVHGMLSGTASMDFGGRKNAGVAVGIIDGFVYLGTAVMSFTYANVLPQEQLDANGQLTGPATDPANWIAWPVAMVPVALLGLVLSLRVWNAKPQPKAAAKPAAAPAAAPAVDEAAE